MKFYIVSSGLKWLQRVVNLPLMQPHQSSSRKVGFEWMFVSVTDNVCAPAPRSLFHYFEIKIISCPVYSASLSPASYRRLGGSQRGPARLGMKRRVHNLSAGMLIFKSKGQLPFHHGGGCGIFSALQMFMNNVCGQTPGWGWGRRDGGVRRGRG